MKRLVGVVWVVVGTLLGDWALRGSAPWHSSSLAYPGVLAVCWLVGQVVTANKGAYRAERERVGAWKWRQ